MMSWFGKYTAPPNPPAVYPSWRRGQYATYFLQREDGSWTAIKLTLLDTNQEGSWLVGTELKTRSGESRALLKVDPRAPLAARVTPGRLELIRGKTIATITTSDHPLNQLTVAMNLVLVAQGKGAADVLLGSPREAHYPGEIDRVHLLCQGKLVHELNPRIPITGLACTSFEGRNPIAVTSFGCGDAGSHIPNAFDDFIDLSHSITVDHELFSLTYPATWFLRRITQPPQSAKTRHEFRALFGGDTCAGALSVTLYHGDTDAISAERDKALARAMNPTPSEKFIYVSRPIALAGMAGDVQAHWIDIKEEKTEGIVATGIFRSDDSHRLAQANVVVNIAQNNPRRVALLEAIKVPYCEILRSFRFS